MPKGTHRAARRPWKFIPILAVAIAAIVVMIAWSTNGMFEDQGKPVSRSVAEAPGQTVPSTPESAGRSPHIDQPTAPPTSQPTQPPADKPVAPRKAKKPDPPQRPPDHQVRRTKPPVTRAVIKPAASRPKHAYHSTAPNPHIELLRPVPIKVKTKPKAKAKTKAKTNEADTYGGSSNNYGGSEDSSCCTRDYPRYHRPAVSPNDTQSSDTHQSPDTPDAHESSDASDTHQPSDTPDSRQSSDASNSSDGAAGSSADTPHDQYASTGSTPHWHHHYYSHHHSSNYQSSNYQSSGHQDDGSCHHHQRAPDNAQPDSASPDATSQN